MNLNYGKYGIAAMPSSDHISILPYFCYMRNSQTPLSAVGLAKARRVDHSMEEKWWENSQVKVLLD